MSTRIVADERLRARLAARPEAEDEPVAVSCCGGCATIDLEPLGQEAIGGLVGRGATGGRRGVALAGASVDRCRRPPAGR